MKKTANAIEFSWKRCLLSVGASLLAFFIIHFCGAFLLSKLGHFENYYELVSWLCFLALSPLFAVPERSGGSFAIARTLIPAALLSIILIAVSLILGSKEATVVKLLLKCSVMLVASFLLLILFCKSGQKRKKRNKKFRF